MKADDYVYPYQAADKYFQNGIQVRDYIAIQAMSAMIAHRGPLQGTEAEAYKIASQMIITSNSNIGGPEPVLKPIKPA